MIGTNLLTYIQRRLSSANVLLHAARKITLSTAVQEVEEVATHTQKYADELEPQLEALRIQLKKKSFTPRDDEKMPSMLQYLFSDQSDVPIAFNEAKKVLPIMVDGLALVGHIDAYLSLATLIRERKDSNAPFCFVEFLENEHTPVIYAEDFFHPSVNKAQVVTNSVTIGDNGNPRNVIISGVNAGGKSTHMKAIAICCIMSQVWGIAPARRFIFTPFHSINTYLNITDDVSKQQSLFRTEIARAQTLLTSVKQLPANHFSFTILDEICTGTERIEGEALAYAIAKKLGLYKNSLVLLASHFPGLTELGKQETDIYRNMKVVVKKDSDGEFIYPYGLYEGSTTQQIAPDLLEKSGLPLTMTQKMRDVLNNPSRYINTEG